jgi:hypothetical protein
LGKRQLLHRVTRWRRWTAKYFATHAPFQISVEQARITLGIVMYDPGLRSTITSAMRSYVNSVAMTGRQATNAKPIGSML